MSPRVSSVLVVAAAAAVLAITLVVPNRQSLVLTVDGHDSAYPSIAASGRFLAVAWGATSATGVTDIYTAVSRDAGRTFARPILTNDDGSPASLSGEQPPTLTLVPRADQDPSVVVTWTAKTPGGTQLLSARSDDGGQSFTRPAALPGSEGPGNRGWQATTTSRDGHVMAVWLDHRELAMPADGAAAPAVHTEHQHGAQPGGQADGVERAQLSKLFFARLDDPGSASSLTGGVCYCCKTAIATGPDGTIYAAWRHVYPGSIRDIAFTTSRDDGRTFSAPVRVSEDEWVLDGCPENGPSMTVDARQRVHVAWPTLIPGSGATSEPTLALFYSQSQDGRSFAPRQRVPTDGVPRHVRITSAPSGVAMVWEEGSGGLRRIALGLGIPDATGRLTWQRRIVSGIANATYPVLATVEDGVVAAWVHDTDAGSVVRVEQVPTAH